MTMTQSHRANAYGIPRFPITWVEQEVTAERKHKGDREATRRMIGDEGNYDR